MDNQETHIEHCNHTIIEKNQKNIFLLLPEIYKWFILKKSVISVITPKVNCGKLYCIISIP